MEFVKIVPTWIENLSKDHELTARVLAAAGKAFAEPVPPTPALVAGLREYLVGYVDRLHHLKEERALFPALVQRAGAAEGALVAAAIGEHARAREVVSRLDAAARAYADGDRGRLGELVEAFRTFVAREEQHQRGPLPARRPTLLSGGRRGGPRGDGRHRARRRVGDAGPVLEARG